MPAWPVGPIVGALVFAVSPQLQFTSTAVVFMVAVGLNLGLRVAHTRRPMAEFMSGLGDLVRLRGLYLLCAMMLLYAALYMQLEVIAPLFAHDLFGPAGVTLLFLVNAGVVIASQALLADAIAKGARRRVWGAGFLCFAGAFGAFAAGGDVLAVFLLGIVVFSLGEVILSLRLDFDATHLSPDYVATAFGIMNLAAAFGGLGGSVIGAALYAGDDDGAVRLTWVVLALAAAAAGLLAFVLAGRSAPSAASPRQAAPDGPPVPGIAGAEASSPPDGHR